MPESSKKNDKKGAKDQRKPRPRPQQTKTDKKPEKLEESKNITKGPQKPPVHESPPEFSKSLKWETEEVLNISEGENFKYKKKEIQSNWAKYEVPIESYDEIDEQENLGADYEKLIDTTQSAGGHFQFKHEKWWDITTDPSPYDKYFEINMDNLNIALCTIPFYQRNNIERIDFTETDILNMDNRATRFKQQYYKNKSFSIIENEVQDKILSSLMKPDDVETETCNKNIDSTLATQKSAVSQKSTKLKLIETQNITSVGKLTNLDVSGIELRAQLKANAPLGDNTTESTQAVTADSESLVIKQNEVIESPEDLEKWLDDFLDS